jgi:hypothetical protein
VKLHHVAWAVLVAMILVGCAGASGAPGGGDDDPDAALGGDDDAVDAATTDAPVVVILPDAAPGTPDANTTPGTPDASTPTTCSPCQLVSQCGCAANQACDLGGANPAAGTTECRAVVTPGMDTSTCVNDSDCAAGFVCLGEAGKSACRRYCADDSVCDGGGGICVIEVTSGTTPIPGAVVCSPSCDPFTASGCPSGWGCGAFSDQESGRNFSWCQVPGAGVNNAACTSDAQCAAGFTCVNTGTATRCKKYCDKGDGNPGCTTGLTCVGLVDANNAPLVVAGVTYGVCN